MSITTSHTLTGLCRLFSYPRKLLMALLLVFSISNVAVAQRLWHDDYYQYMQQVFLIACDPGAHPSDYAAMDVLTNYAAHNVSEDGREYTFVMPYMNFSREGRQDANIHEAFLIAMRDNYWTDYSYYEYIQTESGSGKHLVVMNEDNNLLLLGPSDQDATKRTYNGHRAYAFEKSGDAVIAEPTECSKGISNRTSLYDEDFPYDNMNFFMIPDNLRHVYNVIIKVNIDDFSVRVFYETDVKARMIGTLTMTSPEYDETLNANSKGWSQWIDLEGDDYPYTYTFVAGPQEGYDFMLGLPNPYAESFMETTGQKISESDAFKDWYFAHPYLLFWPSTDDQPHKMDRESEIPENVFLKSGSINKLVGEYTTWYSNPKPNQYGDYTMESPMPEDRLFNQAVRKYGVNLKDLEEGQVYQIKIDMPTLERVDGNYSDGKSLGGSGGIVYIEPESTALAGYTSILKREMPGLVGFQLVRSTKEFENGNQIYYTVNFDADLSAETFDVYRVAVDKDMKVVSCEPYKATIEIYLSNDYLFTDKIVLLPEFEPSSDWCNGTVRVTGYNGTITHNKQSGKVSYPLDANSTAIVVTADGLSDQVFDISLDGIYYKNVYEVTEKKSIKYTDRVWENDPDSEYIVLGTADTTYTRETPAVYFDLNFGNDKQTKATTVPLQAIVPQGIPSPEPGKFIYSLAHKETAENARPESNSIVLHFYDDELRADGKEYLEMVYDLPDSVKINSHDYHITLDYTGSNLEGENFDKVWNNGDPYYTFRFTVDSIPTNVTDFSNGNPGFYNADLGSIYDDTNNGQPVLSTRTIGMQIAGKDVKEPVFLNKIDFIIVEGQRFFSRWAKDMVAEVNLNLEAPNVNYVEEKTRSAAVKTELFRDARQKANGKWEEFIVARGLNIDNTTDTITGGKLYDGGQSVKETALYLVEYKDPSPDVKAELLLMTKEELEKHLFIVAADGEFDSYAAWKSREKDVIQEGEVSPLKIRNVYLFPDKNPGLSTDQEADITAPSAGLKGTTTAVNDMPVYYAVSTPPAEPMLSIDGYNPRDLSGVEDVTVTSLDLARGGVGSAELLSDGTALYNMQGVMVADRAGRHSLVPGIYVARKDNRVQKIVVK